MATVPSPGDGFAVSVVDASDLNTKLVNPVNFLLRRPRAKLRQTVAQSVSNTTFTAITFTTEDLDTDPDGNGGHSTSSNTSRYTANYAGWYRANWTIGFVNNTTGQRIGVLAVNGTQVNGTGVFLNTTSSTWPAVYQGSGLVYLNVGDYVEVMGWQNSGGALNTAVTQIYEQSCLSVMWEAFA